MNQEQELINLLFKKKKTIIFSVLVFSIMALAVTFIIPKKYESISIVYPNKTNSLEKGMNEPEFGYETHVDRLLQLFYSQTIQDSVVEKFGLISYYELDKSTKDWRYKLNKKYKEDVQFSKTKYLSVQVKVETESSKLSADIANYLVYIIDIVRENILKQNYKVGLETYKDKFDEQKIVVDSLLYIIYNFPKSTNNKKDKVLNNRVLEIKQNNKNGKHYEIDEFLLKQNFVSNANTEKTLNDYYFEKGSYNHFKALYKKVLDKSRTSIPKVFVVSKAVENPKKTSPSFLMNLLLGIGLGLVFSVAYILITDKLKNQIS